MVITTKKGDLGKTTYKDITLDKDSPLMEVIGTIDELSAYLVYLATLDHSDKWKERVFELSKLAAYLTGYCDKFDNSYITKLEIEISKCDKFEFKYPFDDSYKAQVNIARTIARRLERRYITYAKNNLDTGVSSYLNRLSDYLYTFE